MRYLTSPAIFDGTKIHSDAALVIEAGVVTAVIDKSAIPTGAAVENTKNTIGPALFDVQVNGGGGVMLNNDPTPDAVRRIAQSHNGVGTAYLLPTVITDRFEITEKAALAVLQEQGKNGVLGLHIEGPHISLKHKGTHNPDFIRPFDDRTTALLKLLRERGLPVLLTLAPECVPPGTIAELTRIGVKVSAGHSAATADQTQSAIDEGLCCVTHLFNGMPAMTSRNPMLTGAAINSTLWCGFIADGHHVGNDMLKLAIRARPVPDRMILVSDAMSTVGGPDQFELYGETIRVKGGRLVNTAGSLAGAHIDLRSSVERVIRILDVPVVDTLRMATTNPFEMMDIVPPGLIDANLDEIFQAALPA